MQQRRYLLLVLASAGTALVTALATIALAGHEAGHTRDSGGAVRRVKVVRSTNTTNISSPTWVNLPGAATRIRIPQGARRDLILATFSAESTCAEGDQPPPESFCSVRILVGGQEMHPQSGDDFGFDYLGDFQSASDFSAHSMQRSMKVSPGTYTVRVQTKVSDTQLVFELDDWHLTVMRID